ncbi:hypothetical protein E2C01_048654 [Portunus trituberculatus]|uniref:Uncharacterized protein n=1 Tax=Portunus trituberculatus TaxID=210409 RepID=A0A5B7GAS1_PORTR|nr:hypothetical protein [Portunus trituberculatus]
MTAHNCQNVAIVELNQHLVMRAFIELIVLQGLRNYVDFPSHQRGGFLDPVLTDLALAGDSVHCRPLDCGYFRPPHRSLHLYPHPSTTRGEPHHDVRAFTTTSSTYSSATYHTGAKQRALRTSIGLLLSKSTACGSSTRDNPATGTKLCIELHANPLHGEKWAKAKWEESNRRMLSSNQLDQKHWWSLVKENRSVTSNERLPALTKPSGDLAVTSQKS